MARISASVYTIARAGRRRWRSTSARPRSRTGSRCSRATSSRKQWLKEQKPDVIFLVYNDHANAFSLDMIPTFAIGTAAEFAVGRRGLGPAPGAQGDRPSEARRRTSRSR